MSEATMTPTCKYCKREIEPFADYWVHVYRYPGRDSVSRLNRCQSPDVPYGQDAEPDE